MSEIGEKKTGWMIIASLPLEEQRTWFEVEKGLNKVLGWEISQFDIFNFEALYEYDGKRWVEVKE